MCICQIASKFVKRFKQDAHMCQTTDHVMDKYVSLAIGGIACATAIPLDNEIINFKMTVNRYLRVL